jgi:hypothetical protein
MDDGRWTMDDGRWTMDDGRWTMDEARGKKKTTTPTGVTKPVPTKLAEYKFLDFSSPFSSTFPCIELGPAGFELARVTSVKPAH